MFKGLAGYYKVGKDTSSFAFGGLDFFFIQQQNLSLRVTTLYYESKKYSPTYERRKRTFINTGTVRKDDARTVSSTAKQAHGGGAHRAERFGAPEKLRVESGAFVFFFLVLTFSFFLCVFWGLFCVFFN